MIEWIDNIKSWDTCLYGSSSVRTNNFFIYIYICEIDIEREREFRAYWMKVALQWELPGRWCQIKLLYRCYTLKTGSEMRREGRRCKSKEQNCSGFLLTFNMHLLVSSRTFCIPSPQFLPSSLLFAASQVPFGFLIIRAVLCVCLLDHYMPSFWLWPGLVWSTSFTIQTEI